ncbi:MAG: iron ABC transporter permease [Chloroflexota bacterium]|nr:iron ABC transporter permease [Chloroflexota bacterium]
MGMGVTTDLPRPQERASRPPVARVSVPGIVLGVAALLLLLIVGYPLLWLLLGALGLPQERTLAYIANVFTQSRNATPLKNTLILAMGTGIGSVVLGVPLAWATARTDMPFGRFIHAMVALSFIAPPYLTTLAYIILLGPNAGHINRLLRWLFHLDHGPINIFSMGGIIFVISLHVMAFPYLLTQSALQTLDAPLEESAQILGASRWTITRRVTLPLVAPAITGGALLAAVESLALFGPQAFLGSPAQLVFLPTRIYGVLGSYPPHFADASALSLLLVLLTVIGLTVQRRFLDRRSFVTVSGRGVRTRRARLGRGRWGLLALCLLIVLFSALLPLGVLVAAAFSKSWTDPLTPGNFTLHNFHTALVGNQIARRGIENSFKLAFGAATLGAILGLFIAYLDQRTTIRGRRVLDYLAILPLGLPGTVLAVGLLQAFIRPPFRLYGTIWILLVAYIARHIPLAVRSASGALRQVDPSLEEAARITNATWLQSLRLILIPLLRSSLVVAWLLIFIPSLGELSATILLYTSGTETIAVAIFRLNDLGQLEAVSALAVFTIAIILLTTLLLQWLVNKRGTDVAREISVG